MGENLPSPLLLQPQDPREKIRERKGKRRKRI